MRVLLAVNNLGLGGVSTYVGHLANSLSVNNDIFIFDHYPYSSDYNALFFLDKRVKIFSVNKIKIIDRLIWKIEGLLKILHIEMGVWVLWRNFLLKYYIKLKNIDIIISFDKFSDLIITRQFFSKVPIVLSLHGSYDISPFYSVSENDIPLFKSIFQRCDAVVYKSACNIEILNKFSNLQNIRIIKRIFHGFTSPLPTIKREVLLKQLGISGDSFVFGMIARGVKEKGWAEALQAFNLINSLERDIHFIVIGSSTYLEMLKEEYAGFKNIHFIGFVENSINWINLFNVGVLPTYAETENFTFSVVEYLFCGKPSIVTNHGELATTLDAGDNRKAGILLDLVNGRPNVSNLADAMLKYYNDRNFFKEHQELTKLAYQKFNSIESSKAYQEILDYLVNNKL